NSAETPETTRSCSTTSGSTTVTLESGTTAGLMVGQRIDGTGMGNDARVDLILSSTSFKLTVPATATGVRTLTFRVYNRPASTVRKITWAENVIIRDMHVITGAASAFQFIQAKDCRVENVTWDMGDRTG